MFQHEIIKTENPQVVVLPSYITLKVRQFLERNGVQCEIISERQIPEDVPIIYTYRGVTSMDRAKAIVTCVEPDCVRDIAEKLFDVGCDQI